MAMYQGRWLEYDERKQTIAMLEDNVDIYRQLMQTGDIQEHELHALENDLDDLDRMRRIHRGEYDFLYFMYEYFSEDRNPGNPSNLIPAGVTMEDAADFHRELSGLLNNVTRGETDKKVSWVVGRGHAKTAYLSNGYLAHQIVYRLKKYIVLVSATTDVAGDFIQWATFQLKYNDKLRDDFGELLHHRKAMNEVDNQHEFVTKSGTKVEAKGVQTQMRGLRHLETRPDLFLLDDLEDKDNTNTPELRAKNKEWFRTEMLPALSRGGMCIYMGTIVHYDSLLAYVTNERKDFESRKFPAILEWSQRQDLWEQWRSIRQEDASDSAERAQQFYEENEAEMLKGTKVLWEAHFSYLDLMKIREDDGSTAFNQEYLGNPIDEDAQVFKMEDFVFYTPDQLPPELSYYIGIDFAMGKEKGDYSAIIVLGKSENDVCYVVDTFIERVHPDKLLDKAVEITMQYQADGIAVESQQAQEWFADKLSQALQRAGYPAVTRMKQIQQRTRKALRIESLLPDIQNATIRFRKHDRLLLEMFELYPNHNHDDAPDALHMAYTVAKGFNVNVRTSRKRTR